MNRTPVYGTQADQDRELFNQVLQLPSRFVDSNKILAEPDDSFDALFSEVSLAI